MNRFTPALLTTLGLVLMIAALAACDDEHCETTPAGDPLPGYRNPETGTCDLLGGQPGTDNCGDFGVADMAALAEAPDMALCFNGCEGLDESVCIDTAGCRAIYAGPDYADCWGVAPSGPDPSLACIGLDAFACSRTDHCVAIHEAAGDGRPGFFVSCADERGTGGDPGSCTGDVICPEAPPDCPPDTVPGRRDCWTGFCIPIAECDQVPACAELDEGTCIGRSDCAPEYRGIDCTCEATGCTCADYVFESCRESA